MGTLLQVIVAYYYRILSLAITFQFLRENTTTKSNLSRRIIVGHGSRGGKSIISHLLWFTVPEGESPLYLIYCGSWFQRERVHHISYIVAHGSRGKESILSGKQGSRQLERKGERSPRSHNVSRA